MRKDEERIIYNEEQERIRRNQRIEEEKLEEKKEQIRRNKIQGIVDNANQLFR